MGVLDARPRHAGGAVVNVAILVWLIRTKHLFGARGGPKTLHEATDWELILDAPAPARHH